MAVEVASVEGADGGDELGGDMVRMEGMFVQFDCEVYGFSPLRIE